MMLNEKSEAGTLDATSNHSFDRRIRIHRLSLCVRFIETRLSWFRDPSETLDELKHCKLS